MPYRTHAYTALLVLMMLTLGVLAGCQAGPAATAPDATPVLLPSEKPTASAAARASVTPAPVASPTPVPSPVAGPGLLTPVLATDTPAGDRAEQPRLMALGKSASITVRALPASAAAVLAVLPGSDVLWAEGRAADGQWLQVAFGENQVRAWANGADLVVFGDLATLPVLPPQVPAAVQPSPAGTPAPGSNAGMAGQVQNGPLNVRAGPGVDQAVLADLAAGTAITATARSQDGAWLAITWQTAPGGPAARGWVAARFITLTGNVQDLPATASSTSQVASAVPPAAAGAARGVGKIAFETRTGGDIYLVNADGSGLRRLTSGIDPVFSPDGNRLAYTRWENPNHGVYVFDLRTGQEQRVATAQHPRGPAWSPDGSKLVFSRVVRSYTCTDTPFGCLSEQQARLIFRGGDCLSTPRGEICLSSYPARDVEETGLTQVTLADGAWHDLPVEVSAQSPGWRPGEAQILYRNENGLQIVADNATQRLVSDPLISSPVWSPDGQRIAMQVRVHDHADIFVTDAAGHQRTALTRREPLSEHPVNNVAPAWSPDGSQILFLTDRDGAWRLYVMGADGSNQRPFLPEVLNNIPLGYDYAAERMASWSR